MDADEKLSDDAKLLILAALEGHDVLADLTGYAPQPCPEPSGVDEQEPIGAFLKRITVRGFRGIGPRSQLDLDPTPSLTVVSGRNGSGKSSFAEALEVALTGTTYRWAERASQWRERWRNIHDGENPRIEVTLSEENVGPTALTVDWRSDSELDDMTIAVQRKGEKKQGGTASLGWAQPLETYRPLLTYEELGALLQGKPHELHDALSTVLGLEQVTDALKTLDEHRKRMVAPEAGVKAERRTLVDELATLEDERATHAAKLLKPKVIDTEQLRLLATGTGDEAETAVRLRSIQSLTFPTQEECDAKADQLKNDVGELAQIAESVGDSLQRREALLNAAIDIHDHEGDQPCPVCAKGTLDRTRVGEMKAELAQHKQDTSALQDARTRAAAAVTQARALIAGVPPVLSEELPAQLGVRAAELADVWARWADVPDDRLKLAEHLTATGGAVREALVALQGAVDDLIATADEAWSKVAARLAAYADDQKAWAKQEPQAVAAKDAHKWLKDNEIVLKNERVWPIAEEAKRIWAGLRQESNVEIAGLTLEGANTRRRVEIKAAVDGEDAGALSVMSQGELHSLALALFLPRATMPESPFRFVVLDDPVQAMDPAKVDGLVQELIRIAKTRQVIVFSHDDRFASAVRRGPKDVPVKILEVSRGVNSTVTTAVTFSPADRYLRDAFGIVKEDSLPNETLLRVVPGLLRMAMEAQARDMYFERELSKGTPHDLVETTWSETRKTRERIALALPDGMSIDEWLAKRSHRRWALRKGNAIHTLLKEGTPIDACRDVEKTVVDLRDGT